MIFISAFGGLEVVDSIPGNFKHDLTLHVISKRRISQDILQSDFCSRHLYKT